MWSFYFQTKARNDEEYRTILLSRRRIYILIVILGLLTATAGVIAECITWEAFSIPVNQYFLGMLVGMGFGLIAGGGVRWWQTNRILKSELLLKEQRLRHSDERLLEIGNKALRTTACIQLFALYIIFVIGGIFSRTLYAVGGVLIALFLITYIIGAKIYEKKM